MRKLLLLGEFTAYRAYLSQLKGCQLLHCHSIDSLRYEFSRTSVDSLLLSPGEWKQGLMSALEDWGRRDSQLRWILLLRGFSPEMEALSDPRRLILSGITHRSWGPQTLRWLEKGQILRRRQERSLAKGGLKLATSEFSKTTTVEGKSFLKIKDISSLGVGLIAEKDLGWPDGEFLEASYKDAEGKIRSYFGQIRWRRPRSDGQIELGFQFLAAAS